MSDFYNRPKFETVDVPIRAELVDAAEQLAHHEHPEHNGGASAVTVLDAILSDHFARPAVKKRLLPPGGFRLKRAEEVG